MAGWGYMPGLIVGALSLRRFPGGGGVCGSGRRGRSGVRRPGGRAKDPSKCRHYAPANGPRAVTAVDWIIVAFTLLMAGWGYMQGLIVGALSLGGFLGGAFAGSR